MVVYSWIKDLFVVVCCVDIVVVVVGWLEMVKGDWFKFGVMVIDVGINCVFVVEEGKIWLVGDVDFVLVSEVVGVIILVLGGVGLMIIVVLLCNMFVVVYCNVGVLLVEDVI